MNTTQVQLTGNELGAIELAAQLTGWAIEYDNDACLEVKCVDNHGDLLFVWSAFLLAVDRCDDSDTLADKLAAACQLCEHEYRWWVEFPTIAAPES